MLRDNTHTHTIGHCNEYCMGLHPHFTLDDVSVPVIAGALATSHLGPHSSYAPQPCEVQRAPPQSCLPTSRVE